jgi:hypothetical protein
LASAVQTWFPKADLAALEPEARRMNSGDEMKPSDDETPPTERPTTPCPRDDGAHSALLEELECALEIARKSMRPPQI